MQYNKIQEETTEDNEGKSSPKKICKIETNMPNDLNLQPIKQNENVKLNYVP